MMNKLSFGITTAAILCANLLALAEGDVPQRRAQHVIVISFDGGKPAVIAESEMPVLKRLAAEGAHTWVANTIFPPKTLPSHTSMTTGVGPDKHQILWNDWMPIRGFVKVPTMFSLATRPVMEATTACQLPQPSGAKIQAMAPPILARME